MKGTALPPMRECGGPTAFGPERPLLPALGLKPQLRLLLGLEPAGLGLELDRSPPGDSARRLTPHIWGLTSVCR